MYEIGLVSHMQIVNNGSLVQMRQFGHVVCFVELRGIDLVGLVLVDIALLYTMSLIMPVLFVHHIHCRHRIVQVVSHRLAHLQPILAQMQLFGP